MSKKINIKIGTPCIAKTCKSCKLCKNNCTVGAIENNTIDSSECISCGMCKSVCKFDSIK